jgi:hypothetical protein
MLSLVANRQGSSVDTEVPRGKELEPRQLDGVSTHLVAISAAKQASSSSDEMKASVIGFLP